MKPQPNTAEEEYQLLIHDVPTATWEEELKQLCYLNRKKLKLKHYGAVLPHFQNNSQRIDVVIQGKGKRILQKILAPLQAQNKLPKNLTTTALTNKELAKYKIKTNSRSRAVILGAETKEDCSICEEYITMTRKPGQGLNWVKIAQNTNIKFVLTFAHKLAKDQFIKRWINQKSDRYEKFMIYSETTAYHKIYNQKIRNQALRQLLAKGTTLLQDIEQNTQLHSAALRSLHRLIPQHIRDQKDTHIIPENLLDFMQIYNIQDQKDVFETATKEHRKLKERRPISFTSQNIGGKLKQKLKPTGILNLNLTIHDSLILATQEVQLSSISLEEFAKTMTIEGYTLVAFSKSKHTPSKNTGGRGSGGLATWIKTEFLNEYTYTLPINNAYIQTIQLTPRKGSTNPPIIFTNHYIKPDWEIERVGQHITNIINNHTIPNNETVSIITGDTNGRHQALGDKLTDARGKLILQTFTNANLKVLNESLAYGEPTNNTQTYQKGQLIQGSSIVDWIITPKTQADYWEKIHISHKERETAKHTT